MSAPSYAAMRGLRVTVRYDLDRAGVLVPEGSTGTIGYASHDYVAVRLDEWVPGLEEWGNHVIVTDGDVEGEEAWGAFRQMFAPIPEPRYLTGAER